MFAPRCRRALLKYALNIERAVNCLLMKVSGWAATDREAMRLVNSWLRESDEVAGVKKLAAYLGCSFPTLYRMLKCEGTPLTLAQFKAVCQYFKKNPEKEILKVFRMTGTPTEVVDDENRPDEISQWTRRQLQKVELADDVLRAVRKYGKDRGSERAATATPDDV